MVQLDELEIFVVVDNETDTLSSVDDGVPQISEIVHLAARTPPSRKYEGHECKTVFDQLCCACHGLSVLITGRRDGQEHSILFDVGPYPGHAARCTFHFAAAWGYGEQIFSRLAAALSEIAGLEISGRRK